MKFFLFVIAFTPIYTVASAQKATQISGRIKNNHSILRVYAINGGRIDSVDVINNEFRLAPNIDGPVVATIMFRNTKGLFPRQYPLYLDGNPIEIAIDSLNVVAGGNVNAIAFQDLWSRVDLNNKVIDNLKIDLALAIKNNSVDTIAMNKNLKLSRQKGYNLVRDFILSHQKSIVSIEALRMLGKGESSGILSPKPRFEEISKLYGNLDQNVKSSAPGEKYKVFLETLQKEL